MSPRAAARRFSARLPSLVGLLVFIVAMVPGAQAQWGMQNQGGNRRARGDGVVRPDDIPGGLSFSEMQRLAKHEAEVSKKRGGGGGGGAGLDAVANIFNDIDSAEVTQALDDMLQLPEFKELLEDPDKFKAVLRDNPILSAVPNLEEVLSRPEFNDPKKLKAFMNEGMKAFKEYASEVVDLIKDPAKMEEAVDYLQNLLTDDEKDRVLKLARGDVGAMSEEMDRLKDVFAKSAEEMMAKMQDPAHLERVRQEYLAKDFDRILSDPDIKTAANDPVKWQELMMENVRLMQTEQLESAKKDKKKKKKPSSASVEL